MKPILALPAVALLVPQAALATDYAVSVKTYALSGCCEDSAQDTSPVSIAGTLGHATGYYDYYVTVAPGVAYLDLDNHSALNSGILDGKQADAAVTYHDFFFTDGTGIPKNIQIWVNLQVEGIASYAAGSSPPLNACVLANVILTGSGACGNGGWSPVGGLWINCGSTSYGAFAGETGSTLSGTFAFGPCLVPTEQLHTVGVSTTLIADPAVGWGGDWIDVSASLRVGFPTGSPAFTLPPGFTVTSDEAGIVDGWYLGSPATDAPIVAQRGAAPELAQNAPNPFRDATTIAFTLPGSAPVSLRVLDVSGRLVRSLVAGERAAGSHTVTWSGHDAGGRRVPAGIYFVRLESGGAVETRRMTLLR